MALEQLGLAVEPQHLHQRRVDREEGPFRRRTINAERGLLHQFAAGGIRAPRRLFRPAPFCDVRCHADDARDAVVTLPHRRELRFELEPEQLDAGGDRFARQCLAHAVDGVRDVPQELEERFAEQHTRPHTQRVQALPLDEREHALGIEGKQDHRRAGDDGPQALLAGLKDLLLADALRDVTGVDDHAVRIRLVESCLTDRLQDAPRAVRVPEAERRCLRRARLLNRIGERFHDRREIVGMHELERVASEELVGTVAQQPLHGRAHIPEYPVIAKNGDDVGRVFRQGSEVLFAPAQRLFHPRALERGREYVGERLDEQYVGTAELPRLRAVRTQHTPGTLTALHDHADAADDAVLLEVWRCAEADFGGEIGDDERTGGVQGVPGERCRVGGDECLAHEPLVPAFARAYQQAAVLGLQLEDLAELDVETAREELGGRLEQVGSRDSGERLLPEVRDRLLLARRRAQLLLGAARFLDAQPAESLRSHPNSRPWKGIES